MSRQRAIITRLALAAVVGVGVVAGIATRPLTAPASSIVDMADMTWIEIRDSIRAGMTTVLVPSGGIEGNGPHMITDKHQHIVRLAARMIAREHGGMLVAPVVALAPQGDPTVRSSNMQWPGTIGVSPNVFQTILEGVAHSLKAAGFKRIVLIADHGGSQEPQRALAERLTGLWRADGVEVIALDAYYTDGDAAQRRLLAERGETVETIGDHAGLQDTAELMFAHPEGVKLSRLDRLMPSFESDGSSGRPERATRELGEKLMRAKVDAAVAALRRAGS
jgi:creatinine amidohydrolase